MQITLTFKNMGEMLDWAKELNAQKQSSVILTPAGPSIDDLGLSVRASNTIKSEGIKTIEQLQLCSEFSLLQMHNLGLGTLKEIVDVLRTYGLTLKTD